MHMGGRRIFFFLFVFICSPNHPASKFISFIYTRSWLPFFVREKKNLVKNKKIYVSYRKLKKLIPQIMGLQWREAVKQGSWSGGRHCGQSPSVPLKARLQLHFNMTDAAQSGPLNLLSIHTGSRLGGARQIYTSGWQPVTYLINGMEQLATANSGLLDSQCVFTSVISANLSIIFPSGLQPLSGGHTLRNRIVDDKC